MRLIWLSAANLRDKSFLQELAHHFPREGKSLIIHEPMGGNPGDTRFVTRKVSSLLSEAMIVNIPLSGEQRGLFTRDADGLKLRSAVLKGAFRTVDLIITNTLFSVDDTATEGDVTGHLGLLRSEFPFGDVVMFPSNSRSPLGKENRRVVTQQDADELLHVFAEEATIIRLALSLAPAVITAPPNLAL